MDHYNVIVIGAGPAGSTAAYICAKSNLSVALIERGQSPGSKNAFGGVIYQQPTADIIPSFWKEAPIERAVTRDNIYFMDENSAVQVGFTGLNFARPPYNKFTAIRYKFDRWYAHKAVEAGADLLTSTVVKDFIYEKSGILNKEIKGVKLEDGNELRSDLVIIAEGAIGDLTLKAGLIKKKKAESLALYVKEILELPAATINERLHLTDEEGADMIFVGYPTPGMIGKGGLFTNKSSISLTLGGYLNQFIERNFSPYQLYERFKQHPLIQRIIKGAKSIKYQAHIIPKSSAREMPAFYDDGVLVIGDALMLPGGQGTAFAIQSGKYAAETCLQAEARHDFSKHTLSLYEDKLKQSYIMINNLQSKKAKDYYQKNTDADLVITTALNTIAHELLTNNMRTESEKRKEIMNELKKIQPIMEDIKDVYAGIKNWRVI